MAMLAGVNIPDSQRIEIGLTAISGIGRSTSKKIISDVGIDVNTRVKDLQEDEMARIRSAIERSQIRIEGDLRREVQLNIRRLGDIGSYRGLRHKNGLPANGQRTKTNARTKKGKRKARKRSKGIYGKASINEIKELSEEGIETETIPWINDNEN